MAQMKPPKTPTSSKGATSAMSRDCVNMCHVHAAVAKAQTSKMPVLLTVPFRVIRLVASIAPPYWLPDRSRKVLSLKAGFEVFIRAMGLSVFQNRVGFHQFSMGRTATPGSILNLSG